MSTFRKIIKRLLYFLNLFPFRQQAYLKEIQRRAKLPLTLINPLAKHINIFSAYSNEIHKPNDWYGHAKVLKRFLGLSENYQFKFAIEHGLNFSNQVNSVELEANFPSVITYSKYRSEIIKRYNLKPFPIGPYIHYAPHFLKPEQLKKEQKKFGDCLLVLPSHPTLEISEKYSIAAFCRKVKKISQNFKTILVCLYWKDILNGLSKVYEDFGFKTVTAGHILDPNFLPRLKSVISFSSLTVSNDAGTHVGYCIYMGKPHIIFPQKRTVTGRKSEVAYAYQTHKTKIYQDVLHEFSKISYKMTPKQLAVINYYWGLDQIKTKKQLQKVIEQTESISA